SAPILLLSAVNMTSGTMAKGSCRLKITWDRIRSFAVPAAPYQMVTMAAGVMAVERVAGLRIQGGKGVAGKPSLTNRPESVAVTVEFSPQQRSAMANSVGAMADPSRGARKACT